MEDAVLQSTDNRPPTIGDPLPVSTVLGPIDPRDLGPTTMHEHLLIDAVEALDDPDTEMIDRPITIDQIGDLRWNAVSNKFNLSLDDPDITVSELRRFRRAGGRGIVDVTPLGIGRRVAELPAISERSGVHIMVGCGFYRGPSHPSWIDNKSAEDVAAYLIDELENGVGRHRYQADHHRGDRHHRSCHRQRVEGPPRIGPRRTAGGRRHQRPPRPAGPVPGSAYP